MWLLRTGILAITLAAASATGALAHSTTPIDRAQARQMSEIQAARANGSLTRREYEALVAEQTRIADMKAVARRNGVTGREFRRIRRAQHDAAVHIDHLKTNRKVNYWRRWASRYR